ncbi:MAG: hypothetical protein AMXMBFR84_36950 [Candidatus Hydrogenedentota bacterium]
MNFRKHSEHEDSSLQLAPLIDIVFLTLVFFMTTTVYSSQEREVDIQLPTASTSQQIERARGEIYINIREDGQVVLNNRELTLPELQEVLFQVAESFPGGSVIVRGDRLSHLGVALGVLDCCRKADIQNVSFAAVQDEYAQ